MELGYFLASGQATLLQLNFSVCCLMLVGVEPSNLISLLLLPQPACSLGIRPKLALPPLCVVPQLRPFPGSSPAAAAPPCRAHPRPRARMRATPAPPPRAGACLDHQKPRSWPCTCGAPGQPRGRGQGHNHYPSNARCSDGIKLTLQLASLLIRSTQISRPGTVPSHQHRPRTSSRAA